MLLEVTEAAVRAEAVEAVGADRAAAEAEIASIFAGEVEAGGVGGDFIELVAKFEPFEEVGDG